MDSGPRAPVPPDGVRRTVWLTRPDLREFCGWDRARFDWWLTLFGGREYRALEETAPDVPADLLTEPAEEAAGDPPPVLTRFMKLVWTLRPDLRRSLDPGTVEGRHGIAWWCFIQGVGQHGFARFLTGEQRCFLNGPDPGLTPLTRLPVTRLMRQVWERHPDLRRSFPLDTPNGQAMFLVWYYGRGVDELRLSDLIDERQARALMEPPHRPLILEMIHGADPTVGGRFPDTAHPDFHAWARDGGGMERPILRRLRILADPASPPAALPAPAVRPVRDLPAGVNLIGYARGQFGVGEDVRMAALALRAAGVPCAIHNIEPGREVCQGDRSADALITDGLPYAVNLFCMTGIETARMAAIHGSALFDGRRSIGYWPWELPEWPEEWRHAYDLVDEVWASSRYTYEAFGKSCPKPVRHAPMAVTADATAGLDRRALGLPEGRFLFVFSFDVLSSHARKNPLDCIRAFRRAFPLGDEPAGLVIKVMRAEQQPFFWQALREEAGMDGRVSVIARTLDRGAVLDLYRACDGFLSLHRSEGFGRGIAEAMILGRPVIVTGHSGNMDFTVPGTAALVDHRLRRVGRDEYPFGEGQLWAEPDPDHAAWWMRRMVAEPWTREALAAQGRLLATASFAPAAVGARYAALLGL